MGGMRIVIAALAALIPTLAAAATLPIRPGIIYCGDGLDLSADGVGGEDFFCKALEPAASDGAVSLYCEHSEPEYGEPWTMPAVVVENIPAETVHYENPDGPVTLSRCP